jgi:transcriptional regulator with XRE-family HTH domain
LWYNRIEREVIMASLGYTIRALRMRKNWSLGQLSTYSGVAKSYLSRIEKDEHPNVSAKRLSRVARALEVTVQYLVEEAGWYPKRGNIEYHPDVDALNALIQSFPAGQYKSQAELVVRNTTAQLKTIRSMIEGGKEGKTIDGGKPAGKL